MRHPNLKVGDRVALTRQMLRLGFPDVRGTVDRIASPRPGMKNRLLYIRWDGDPQGSSRVMLECNVIMANRIHLEPV